MGAVVEIFPFPFFYWAWAIVHCCTKSLTSVDGVKVDVGGEADGGGCTEDGSQGFLVHCQVVQVCEPSWLKVEALVKITSIKIHDLPRNGQEEFKM